MSELIEIRPDRTNRVTQTRLRIRNHGPTAKLRLAGLVLSPTNPAYLRLLVMGTQDGRATLYVRPGDSIIIAHTICMDEELEIPDDSVGYRVSGRAPTTLDKIIKEHALARRRVSRWEAIRGDKTKATLTWAQKECWKIMSVPDKSKISMPLGPRLKV